MRLTAVLLSGGSCIVLLSADSPPAGLQAEEAAPSMGAPVRRGTRARNPLARVMDAMPDVPTVLIGESGFYARINNRLEMLEDKEEDGRSQAEEAGLGGNHSGDTHPANGAAPAALLVAVPPTERTDANAFGFYCSISTKCSMVWERDLSVRL
jgi:hypothetical protein